MVCRMTPSKGRQVAANRGVTVVAASVAITVGLVAPAPAQGLTFKSAGLTVDGANGYSISVGGSFGNRAVLSARKKSGAASYDAPGAVSKRKIRASLGKRGRVSVRFDPRGKPDVRRGCGGIKTKIQRGTYEGKIRFKGEHGYTKVRTRKAKGAVSVTRITFRSRRGSCGPSSPDVGLRAATGNFKLAFSAAKYAGGKVTFSGLIQERKGRVEIFRSAFARGPAGSFTYDDALTEASVDPPAPFSGSATYADGSPPIWTGNLAARVPGRRGKIRLTGPTFTALSLTDFSAPPRLGFGSPDRDPSTALR